jgi:hypothetical protein
VRILNHPKPMNSVGDDTVAKLSIVTADDSPLGQDVGEGSATRPASGPSLPSQLSYTRPFGG